MKPVDKNKLSYDQKLEKYKNGEYVFKPPPVCTARWDDDSWIKFIDASNNWLEKS